MLTTVEKGTSNAGWESRPPNHDRMGDLLGRLGVIRHLHRSEMLSQRAIAKQLGVARKTVAAALASDEGNMQPFGRR